MTELAFQPLISPTRTSALLNWRQCPFPIGWARLFDVAPQALKLHLEIGFGDGRYTAFRAQQHPEEQFVGVEISSPSLKRALRRMNSAQITNVILLKAGAEFITQHLFAPQSLESITVNFPCPWPKERHVKYRLLSEAYFQLASTRLKLGGTVRLATDHPEYLAFSKTEAARTGLYRLYAAEPPAAVFETKYALKWKEAGKPLYYHLFEVNRPSPQLYPILERNKPMPHAILQGELPRQTPFQKIVMPYAEGHVVLHEASQSWGVDTHARILVRATVQEPDLQQQLLVVIKHRQEKEVLVGLETFGDPIITRTTRGAVHAVTEWLLSLGEDLTVIKRDY